MSARLNTVARPGNLIILSTLLVSASLWAASDNLPPPTESLSPEKVDEECYCSVRKRQQVKIRLEKQNKLEQE